MGETSPIALSDITLSRMGQPDNTNPLPCKHTAMAFLNLNDMSIT